MARLRLSPTRLGGVARWAAPLQTIIFDDKADVATCATARP